VPPPDTELVDPAIQVDLIGLTAEQLVVTITGELPATPANIARVPGAGMTRYENAGADGVPLPVQDLSSEIDGNALKVTVTAVSDENSIFAITLPELTAVPGDCNQDGELRLSDAVCLLGALFRKRAAFPCGDGSRNESANVTLLDWQPNGSIGIADAVGLIHFLVLGGAPHPLAVESAETTACVPIPGCTPGPSCP
jgi:hypothetical protein